MCLACEQLYGVGLAFACPSLSATQTGYLQAQARGRHPFVSPTSAAACHILEQVSSMQATPEALPWVESEA